MTAGASQPSRRAAFLDRDGVINIDRGYVHRREDFSFVWGALEGARALHELGFLLVVVTNQSGIGRGQYSQRDFDDLTTWMRLQFEAARAPIAAVYCCPHHPADALGEYLRECDCRKPQPGMLLTASRELSLNLRGSVLFGDHESDLQAARAANVPLRILLGTDGQSMPAPLGTSGLATAMYRSLGEAMSDEVLVTALREQRSVPA